MCVCVSVCDCLWARACVYITESNDIFNNNNSNNNSNSQLGMCLKVIIWFYIRAQTHTNKYFFLEWLKKEEEDRQKDGICAGIEFKMLPYFNQLRVHAFGGGDCFA